MEGALKNVYAVIVSWNGAEWIREALESLRHSTFPVRIVVVDNASTDETVHIIQDSYPEVKLLCMPSNLGFGKANNQGMCHALSQGADYVLLLNQDARVDPAMIASLVNLLNEHPDLGIVSPLQLDYQGVGIEQGFLAYIRDNANLVSDAFLGRLHELYEVPFVPAAVWLLTRRMLEKVGGFDPIFFMYGEDLDFRDRARFHGFKIGIAPKAFAYHWHHQGNGNAGHAFGTQSAVLYAVLLYRLTRPDRHFLRNLGKVLFTWIHQLIINLLAFKFTKFFAGTLALFRILINIFRIWRHYDQCRGRFHPSPTCVIAPPNQQD